jgi:hypothetical protein
MTSRVSSGLWGRASHFAFITRSGTWNFYMQALRWSTIAFFFHQILSSRVFAVLAFAAPLIVPVVTMRLTISPRLFMLPLKRAEIVKCWGIAVFVSLVKSWAALAVPYGVLVLTAGTTSTDPIPLPLLMATTLAAQLPIFGATMAISSLKIRYSVFLLPFFFLFGIAGIVAAFQPTIIVGILLGSIILGPLLIWFAYRRWCNAEIRFSSAAQALSQS